MKILFYTDPHLRETSSYPLYNRIQSNGLSGELNNTLLGFDFIEDLIYEIEPDLVILGGDTFQKDNLISVRTLKGASLAMEKVDRACKKLNIDHLILSGNHDTYGYLEDGTRISSTCALGAYGTLIDYPEVYDLKGFSIYLIPHVDSLDSSYQEIVTGTKNNLIACHLDFLGAVNDNGAPAEHGLDSHWGTPILCGHIHLKQEHGDVFYAGSLIQKSFSRGDLEGAGGALIYDTDTGSRTYRMNDRSKHFVKVKDINILHTLNPDLCILKVYSDTPEDEVKKSLEGFEYVYVPSRKDKNNQELTVKFRGAVESPRVLLRSHINSERPDLVDLYDEVVR